MAQETELDSKILEVVHHYLEANNGIAKCRQCKDVTLRCPETWTVQKVLRREKICRKCASWNQQLKGHVPTAPLGTRCFCCEREKMSEADIFDGDHISASSLGRKDPHDQSNIRYLCATCNRSKQEGDSCKIHGKFLGR